MKTLRPIRTGVLLLVATVCANAQDPQAEQGPDVSLEDEATTVELPAAEPWDESFAVGVGEVVRLAASDDPGAALDVCDRLLSPDTYGRWRTSLDRRRTGRRSPV